MKTGDRLTLRKQYVRNTVKAKVMEATLIILEYRMELNRRRAMYEELAKLPRFDWNSATITPGP